MKLRRFPAVRHRARIILAIAVEAYEQDPTSCVMRDNLGSEHYSQPVPVEVQNFLTLLLVS